MSGTICAIHQPNFFPWLGYFDKIRRSNVFVLLDRVDYPRAGSGGMGSWTNRVQLTVAGQPKWVGAPLRRAPLGTPIDRILIDDSQPWRRKLARTLQVEYRKAPRYEQVWTLLEPLLINDEDRLAEFNIASISAIASHLGLNTPLRRQSELPHDGKATDLLISLVKAAGADVYLAGGGAGGYQADDAFAEAGVELRYQNFLPSVYGPMERFRPGLSVIDYLMFDGRPLTESFPDAS